MDDFDLEELPRKKYEEEMSFFVFFFFLYEQQTRSFEWGHNTQPFPVEGLLHLFLLGTTEEPSFFKTELQWLFNRKDMK